MNPDSTSKVDFEAFRKEREKVQRQATEEIARRVAEVQRLILEIKSITDATGVTVSLFEIYTALSNAGGGAERDNWNSSSDEC